MKKIFLHMQKLLFSLILLFGVHGIYAQELGLHFMEHVYQSNFTNPSKIMKKRMHIGLPSFSTTYGFNGPTLADMLRTDENGQNIIDIDAGLVQLKDDNFLNASLSIETFSFGYRHKRLQLGISHAIRSNFQIGFPRTLPEFVFNGNVQYIDQTVDLAPMINMLVYGELGLHGAYEISDKLSVGGRLKFLSGVGNISTSKHQLSVYTNPDYYQITAQSDLAIHSAGTFFDLDIVTTSDSTDFNLNTSSENIRTQDLFFGKNAGFAVDLGVTYQVNEQLTLSASILDLGGINWKTNNSTFESNGSYTFEGVNADDVFFGGDTLDFNGVLDTVVDILGFQEVNESYRTNLASKFYFSGSYKIKDDLTAGAVFYGEFTQDQLRPAIAFNVQKEWNKVLHTGLVYSIKNGTFNNLGLHFGLQLGVVQLFGTSDNIISVFQPFNTKNVHFRAGLNFAFQQKKVTNNEKTAPTESL